MDFKLYYNTSSVDLFLLVYIRRVRFAGGDGGDYPPLWFTRPTLCWIIFILGGDKNYPPHPKYFHHYIVIINNQNTQGPSSFWLCCDFDLPGASQRRRARRKQFYFENQPDLLAFLWFQKSTSCPRRNKSLNQMDEKWKEYRAAYLHIWKSLSLPLLIWASRLVGLGECLMCAGCPQPARQWQLSGRAIQPSRPADLQRCGWSRVTTMASRIDIY